MLELAAATNTEDDAEDHTVTVREESNTDTTRLRGFQLATQSDEIDSLLQVGSQSRNTHGKTY